jgi:hypothetical protein
VIDPDPGLAVAGALGVVLAFVVLRSVLSELAPDRARWPHVGAAAIAVTLLVPVMLILFEQTQHFRARDLTEVGSAAFEEPPMSEEAARAVREALGPGDTWATVTPLGRCADIDLYAFYWLAFRLVPNAPDCESADVELYLSVDPPRDATVIDRGRDFAVLRP